MIATGFSRFATSVSCGPDEGGVEVEASPPSFDTATVASMKPRWLRHMIPTPSPSLRPASESAWASALVRRCTSSKVSVPSSSTIIVSSG